MKVDGRCGSVVAVGTVTVIVGKVLTILAQKKLDEDLPCGVHSHGERKRIWLARSSDLA